MTEKLNIVKAIGDSIVAENQRSAWGRGVTVYACELLCDLCEAIRDGYLSAEIISHTDLLEEALLNGARDWEQFSWGGSSLIYDEDIAERLCTPSELKKRRYGVWRPNQYEEWLDVQARALRQACNRIKRHAKKVAEGNA